MSCPRGCCASYREHLLSVNISSTATPSRKGAYRTRQIEETEKRWSKDFAAVRSLAKDKIVPKKTAGLADLAAKAETRYEIERGKLFTKQERSALEHVFEKDIK